MNTNKSGQVQSTCGLQVNHASHAIGQSRGKESGSRRVAGSRPQAIGRRTLINASNHNFSNWPGRGAPSRALMSVPFPRSPPRGPAEPQVVSFSPVRPAGWPPSLSPTNLSGH